MGNLKISTRLSSAFGVIVMLLLLLAGASLLKMKDMNDASGDLATNWLPAISTVKTLNLLHSDLRLLMMEHIINSDKNNISKIDSAIQEQTKEIEKAQKTYELLISEPEEKMVYPVYLEKWQRLQMIEKKALDLSRQGLDDDAKIFLERESKPLFDSMGADLDKLVKINEQGSTEAAKKSNGAYTTAHLQVIVLVLIALAATVALSLFIIRSITTPLNQAVEAARHIAQGDLSRPIEVRNHDELGTLLSAMSEMQTSLIGVVGSVRTGSESVATASAEIAQGNQDLSSRTENQASALEQTASSMEHLGSTVRQNADNARQANQLAQQASSVAAEGGEVVGQVVETMKEINTSSQKIADIISVIDGIAFQTNILALNAAVEAARAGEQGRGFAVVASEVRALAGRSAAAAKEIKTLIDASVDRVGQGTLLVDKAGQTMSKVVSSIQQVTDIMGEISAASTEQSAGVIEIGQAVTQMDQATQQNAALVEEMAAAAGSLKIQAQELVQTVSVFQLGGNGQRSNVQRPPAASPATRPTVRHASALPAATAARPSVSTPPPRKTAAALPPPAAPRTTTAQNDGDWESF
ncbi:MAG: MCP four helix bundle domain-containing protein [Burkholderiaceae bacterium]|nr:MCP four helix bundle domain-containing protein [Burkholderiaceae bacterium]